MGEALGWERYTVVHLGSVAIGYVVSLIVLNQLHLCFGHMSDERTESLEFCLSGVSSSMASLTAGRRSYIVIGNEIRYDHDMSVTYGFASRRRLTAVLESMITPTVFVAEVHHRGCKRGRD